MFHKVVQRCISDIVGSLMINSSHIHCWVYWWKKLENWLTFDEVTGKSRVSCFLRLTGIPIKYILPKNSNRRGSAIQVALEKHQFLASILLYLVNSTKQGHRNVTRKLYVLYWTLPYDFRRPSVTLKGHFSTENSLKSKCYKILHHHPLNLLSSEIMSEQRFVLLKVIWGHTRSQCINKW